VETEQPDNATKGLLRDYLAGFAQQIQCCNSPFVLERLNTALAGDGEDGKESARSFSTGSFSRHQVPSLLEHFGAESTQGVLLLCSVDKECAFTLWFQNGALIHAEGQDSIGRTAIKACCQCQEGSYLYTEIDIPADIPASFPGGRGVTFLLLDTLREIDEELHGTAPAPPANCPKATEEPTVELESAQFAKLMHLVEAVREGLLMQNRAELDAWYYRQGTEQTQRYAELQRRALGRLYQWMAANGLMATVNELQEMPSTHIRCERLTELLDHLGSTVRTSNSQGGDPLESSADDVDWSILEEDGSTI